MLVLLCEPVPAPREVEQFLHYFCGDAADPGALVATEPLRILCIGSVLFAPQALMVNYFVNQLGRPSVPLLVGALSLVVSVVAGVLLIPDFGTVGAAWSTTVGYGASSVVSVIIFCRTSKLPFSELWRVRVSDIRSYFVLARDVLSGRAFAGMRARSET